jgi:hypothetical protein
MGGRIFSVGHYLGPYHRPGGGRVEHRVRVGRALHHLRSDQHLLAWMYGHGVGEFASDEPWTRESLVDRARLLADEDLAAEVAELVSGGLMVEVSAEGGRAFAERYRLRGLMMCLGPDPDAPDEFLLGLPNRPAIGMTPLGRRAWLTAQHAPALWSACLTMAEREPEHDALAVVNELLAELIAWLGAGVAYLDVAEATVSSPPPASPTRP